MKKLLTIALLVLLAATVLAQEVEITISSPAEGSEVFVGRNVSIEGEIYIPEGKNMSFLKSYFNSENPAKCAPGRKTDRIYNFNCPVTPTTISDANVSIGAQVGDTVYTATLTLNVTNRIYPEIVYPSPTGPTNLTDKKHIKARFWYPGRDRQYDLGIVVEADVNGEKVNFVWNESEALFVAEYDLERLERGVLLEMKISLLGDVSGSETFYPIIAAEGVFAKREEFPLAAVLGAVGAAGAVVVIAVWFFAFRKKRAETHEELEARRKHLKEIIKMTTVDFYKRRITEEEFKKRSMDYQLQLDEVEAKLRVQKSEAKAEQKPAEESAL